MGGDFVIDNSVVMAWLFEDECDAYSEAILDQMMQWRAWVPVIWPLEVANVLLVAERRQRIRHRDSAQFLHYLSDLPILVESQEQIRVFNEVLALGRDHNLSTYDASYIEIALRKKLPLATRDQDMVKAAEASNIQLVG
jgi:predicted nucleic acid-binding protein